MLSADMMRYVELHRTAGFKFRTQHEMLARFVIFAEQHGDEFVRVDRVLEWAARAPSAAQRCKLLLEVRRFALAMRPEDRRYEVPAADALGRASHRRRIVHIYTPDEISRLVQAATQLGPTGSIRPWMYATLFGLLAATGLRISEALALQITDLTSDGLIIRQTKFKKSSNSFRCMRRRNGPWIPTSPFVQLSEHSMAPCLSRSAAERWRTRPSTPSSWSWRGQ